MRTMARMSCPTNGETAHDVSKLVEEALTRPFAESGGVTAERVAQMVGRLVEMLAQNGALSATQVRELVKDSSWKYGDVVALLGPRGKRCGACAGEGFLVHVEGAHDPGVPMGCGACQGEGFIKEEAEWLESRESLRKRSA
jgi:hypothetical protein